MLGYVIINNLKPEGINTAGSPDGLKISGMLYARPRVCLKTGKITGIETCVRKTEHLIDEEENLNAQLLDELFYAARQWIEDNNEIRGISVHMSGDDLCNENFINNIIALKEKYGLPNGAVEIELKGEHLKFCADYDENNINTLRKAGFCFSIHNFGEGVSLIAILRRYPIDLIKFKIGLFGHSLPTEKERAMFTHIVRMSHTMDIPVLCEGIESLDQAECAKLTESDMASGDYFGRAVPAMQFGNAYSGYVFDL